MNEPLASLDVSTRRRAIWVQAALVFLCAFLLQATLQTMPGVVTHEDGTRSLGLRSRTLPVGDTPYHIRMAWLYRTGAIAEAGSQFHWMRHSVWADRFVNKEFLYHIYLVPFTLGASDVNDTDALIWGAKLANCTTFALLALTLFGVLRALGVRRPWLFTAMMLVLGGISFCSRSEESRAWPFYVMCSLLAWLCMAQNRRLALVIVACIFTLSYAAAHFLLILWGLRTAMILLLGPETGASRKSDFVLGLKQLGAIACGVALGVLLHPGRADFVHTWVVTYVQVFLGILRGPLQQVGLSMAEALGVTASYSREDAQRLRLGVEFLPFAGTNLLIAGGAAFASPVVLTVLSAWHRHKPSREAMLALAMGTLTLVMYVNSMRFAEVMGPFMALFFGIWIENWLRCRHVARHLAARPVRARRCALAGTVLVLLAAAGIWVWTLEGKGERKDVPVTKTAQWLRDNPKARGKLVWHAQWDMFPALFFYAPQSDYVVGMDPHYLLAHSREKSNLTCDILDNVVDNETLERVQRLFAPDYILVVPGVTPAFFEQCRKAEAEGKLRLAFVDEKAGIGVYEVIREK